MKSVVVLIPLVSDPEFRGCAQVKFQHEHKCTKEIQAVTGKKHALKKNDQFFFLNTSCFLGKYWIKSQDQILYPRCKSLFF